MSSLTQSNTEDRPLRKYVYWLLIASAVAGLVGRIAAVKSRDGKTAFLCANDRSRWATIRSLVDHRTYAIDEVINEKPWDTIDKVRHEGRDGQLHFYSSKPPLMVTLCGGVYWSVKSVTGATLEKHPFYVARIMLVAINGLAIILYLALFARWVEVWGTTDWGRIFVVACASWGTFLTAFAVSLNNHLFAAVSVLVASYAVARIWYDGRQNPAYFFVAGLASGFAVANELPALSFCCLMGLALLFKSWSKTLLAFMPGVLIVAVGFVGTNYLAHDTWKPAYSQRHVPGGWYDYPGSYWSQDKLPGVDAGEPSRAKYAFHSIVGHHGILSLTPIWMLTIVGLGMALFGSERKRMEFALLTILLTAVCLFFYLVMRPEADRNYGGVTSGFRWMFWFVPLWLTTMIPAADLMSRARWTRVVAVLLLAVSIFSATFSASNPWQHPWIYQYLDALGQIGS